MCHTPSASFSRADPCYSSRSALTAGTLPNELAQLPGSNVGRILVVLLLLPLESRLRPVGCWCGLLPLLLCWWMLRMLCRWLRYSRWCRRLSCGLWSMHLCSAGGSILLVIVGGWCLGCRPGRRCDLDLAICRTAYACHCASCLAVGTHPRLQRARGATLGCEGRRVHG